MNKPTIKISDDAIHFYGQQMTQDNYESELIYKTFIKIWSDIDTPYLVITPNSIRFRTGKDQEFLIVMSDCIIIDGKIITDSIAEIAYLRFTQWLQLVSKNFPS